MSRLPVGLHVDRGGARVRLRTASGFSWNMTGRREVVIAQMRKLALTWLKIADAEPDDSAVAEGIRSWMREYAPDLVGD